MTKLLSAMIDVPDPGATGTLNPVGTGIEFVVMSSSAVSLTTLQSFGAVFPRLESFAQQYSIMVLLYFLSSLLVKWLNSFV